MKKLLVGFALFAGVFCSFAHTAQAVTLYEVPAGADAATINQAIQAVDDGGTVRFGAGTWTLDATLELSRDVTVEGAGADQTTLDFGLKCRGFELSHASATVADLKIYRGQINNGEGGGVSMSKGTVRNCLIADCKAHASTGSSNKGGGVNMLGGLLTGCEITGCLFDNLYGLGNAIYMTGGTVTGCDIHGNNGGYSHSTLGYGSGVVCLNGGTLENSKIHDNSKDSNPGVYVQGGTVRNCLIYGNKGKDAKGKSYGSGGIYTDDNKVPTVLYCTVFGNTMAGDTTGRSGLYLANSATVKNSIFWANGPSAVARWGAGRPRRLRTTSSRRPWGPIRTTGRAIRCSRMRQTATSRFWRRPLPPTGTRNRRRL